MVNTGDMSVNPGNTSTLVYKYMRPEHLPHIWCPGCGNGIIMRDVAQAIENLGLSRNKTVIVSGIGCSSRAAGYLDFNTIHTTHGRAIAFATGNPHRLHRKSNERRLQPKPQKRPQVHRLQRGFQFGKHIRRNIGGALNEPACLRDNALRHIEHSHDDIECI